MKAAVISSIGQVGVETVDDPTPGPGQVVIKVSACGLCGTDLHILQGEFAPTLPIIPGHEFAGEIVALGSGVMGLK
ncbi:alcohol dehydrogenase catalytic domain-containing protein, partial [Streptomyces sp. NRRL S-15]